MHRLTLYLIKLKKISGPRSHPNRPIARISQRGVQLDLVGNHCSRGLRVQPPDADNNLIFDFL